MIDADAKPVSLDFALNSTVMNNQSSSALESLPDGRVLVTWSSDEGNGDGAQTCGLYFIPLVGETGADSLVGTGETDLMMSLGGDNQVAGHAGDDSQRGGNGKDSLASGSCNLGRPGPMS